MIDNNRMVQILFSALRDLLSQVENCDGTSQINTDAAVNAIKIVGEPSVWLDQLRAMPDSPERDDAIAQAERWMADAR